MKNNLTSCILADYLYASTHSATAAILPQSEPIMFICKMHIIIFNPEACTESAKKNKQGKQSNTQTPGIESTDVPNFSHSVFIP